MKGRITLVAFMMFTVLSLGLSSNTAFAVSSETPGSGDSCTVGHIFDALSGLCEPLLDCQVHAKWFAPFSDSPIPPEGLDFSITDCPDATDFSSITPVLNCFNPIIAENGFDPRLECHVELPNFIDNLNTKLIFIDIFYDGAAFDFPQTLTVIPNDSDDSSAFCDTIVAEISDEDSNVFIYDIECHPNPDSEEIFFTLPPYTTAVVFWTESFNDQAVGGTFVPIDTTALLLAGVQSVSMWMIPVVLAGIGIGVFVIKRRN